MKDKKIGKLFKLKDEGNKSILPEYIYPIKSNTIQYEILVLIDSDFSEAHNGLEDRMMLDRTAMNKYYQVVEDS